MKTLFALLTAACLCLTARAQTNTVWVTNYVNLQLDTNSTPFLSGPAADLFHSLLFTNVIVVGYGEINMDDTSKYGGGLAIGYHASDYLVPFVRLDYIDHNITEVSATAQLQLPATLFGKLTLVPLAYAGTGTAVGGKGPNNGNIVGILGAGGAIRIGSQFDILASYEMRTGQGIQDHLALLGVGVKFGKW